MKTYNRPVTQVTKYETRYMLMTDNVSGGAIKGVKDQGETLDENIIIH